MTHAISSSTNGHLVRAIQTVLSDRPIAYHACLARVLKSVTAGVLLSQLLFWAPRTNDPDGWFWKTRDEIEEETGLGRSEQETARRVLRQAGVLDEQLKGVPARVHYHVNLDVLVSLLSVSAEATSQSFDDTPQPDPTQGAALLAATVSSWRKSSQLVGGTPSSKPDTSPPANTETTTEMTTDILRDDVVGELKAFGIDSEIAVQLAQTYEPAYVRDRLDRIRYLMDTNPTAIRKTPQAFLVAAIKHPSIDPAPDYKTPAQRQAAAAAKVQAQADAQAAIAAEQAQQEKERAAEQGRTAQAVADLRRRYPPVMIPETEWTTKSVWNMVLSRLRTALKPSDYTRWLSQTILVSCDRSKGILAAQNSFCAQWLHQRFDKSLRDELEAVLGFPVRLEYVALSDLAADSAAIPDAKSADGSTRQAAVGTSDTAVDRGEILFDHSRDRVEPTGVRTRIRGTSAGTSSNTSAKLVRSSPERA